MITRGIRGYVSRDWEAARESKDAWWAARIGRLGPAEGLRITDELRRRVLAVNPRWPDEEDRRLDLEAHARLSRLLRDADRARREDGLSPHRRGTELDQGRPWPSLSHFLRNSTISP